MSSAARSAQMPSVCFCLDSAWAARVRLWWNGHLFLQSGERDAAGVLAFIDLLNRRQRQRDVQRTHALIR